MKISTVEQMRAMDQAAIRTYGIDEALLMENAGGAAARVWLHEMDGSSRNVLILCGGGNNGGDGLVVARHLHAAGASVRVRVYGNPERYAGAAKLNWSIAQNLGIDISVLGEIGGLGEDLAWAGGVVDALLGTGITREVAGLYAEVIERVNRSGLPVLSIDIPSGVNGDTGRVLGTAVQADCTVTFGLPKIGNLLYPGYELGGKLFVSHISFPPVLTVDEALQIEVNAPPALPKRNPAGHKGSFGQALFIAGAANYYGAPYYAAMSFLKAGGGYARLATPRSLAPVLASNGGEIVYLPQRETEVSSLAQSNQADLLDITTKMDFVVMGPGLSLHEETQQLVRELAARIDKPLLIDGDGLTAVHQEPDCLRQRSAPTILTPHMGEMARLTGRSVPGIEAEPVTTLRAVCRDLKALVVMKGAHSLVGYPDGRVYVNLSGNSGMATAGSGDVLTGSIAAMAGLGLPVEEAVRMGVFVHGLAGDLAAASIGEDGMTASDVLAYLPEAVRLLRTPEGLPAGYLGPQVV